MENDQLRKKQLELERRNQQLEDRKRQIQLQLKGLQMQNYQQENFEIKPSSDKNIFSQEAIQQQKEQHDQNQEQKDIINQLQSIKKANIQKNQNKIIQLKKQFDLNKSKIFKNQQRIQKLQNNIELAKSAVRMKNQLKQQIQSKGKKLSEQSKKWISEVSKLNDKTELLRNSLVTAQKQQQALKIIFQNSQRKLNQIKKQKISYQTQGKTINGKIQNLKAQIQKAKQLLKQKQIINKQQNTKSQKQKQKLAVQQKRLQRQKNELIKAYKKLSQYISLLRKCNTHLQTANSLGFGLKQYLQAIDKSDMIA